MAIESSSATSPRSRRPTIASSSSMARSNGMAGMSGTALGSVIGHQLGEATVIVAHPQTGKRTLPGGLTHLSEKRFPVSKEKWQGDPPGPGKLQKGSVR